MEIIRLFNNDSSYILLVPDTKYTNPLSMSSAKIWRIFTGENIFTSFNLTYVVRQGCANLYVNFKHNSTSSQKITQSENVKSL
jgi:hypothetical protein